MIFHSKKEDAWNAKDYARTIVWFAAHTLLIIAVLGVLFLWNAGFSIDRITEFFGRENSVRNTVYLVAACFLISASLYFYFYSEHRNFILRSGNINLLFTVLEVSLAATVVVGKTFSLYARPFALCALLTLLLIDRKSAIFMNVASSLFMFLGDLLLAVDPIKIQTVYSCLITGFFTGLLAIYLVYGISSRLRVFTMGFALAIPIFVNCVMIEFEAFKEMPAAFALQSVTSGMLSVVLMMALVPFFEAAFKVLTIYRLAEITDHKSKLIKALIENAPGTFNHSLVVSTLAESCASAIGENALLARACAYYHDIGKLKQPEFFSENQQGYNPHDELTPELSTDIIRSHAKDGYDLIRKYRLPQILADVALQHHGTMPIRYFYMKAKKYTEGELEVANFSYQGPKPQTKIAAIIMIADGCEAKVRTVADRSHENVEKAVREIIEERMDFGQFDECELTMKDLDIIRRSLTNSLTGVYHDRVKYPKLRIGKRNDE
ncbi:MAG TPA: hypothetical protein DDW54_03885 [Clostridiales bacterium]|nr:hypothetical protein [Clostridiales bacterium]